MRKHRLEGKGGSGIERRVGAVYISGMTALLALTLITLAPGSFEGMSRQMASLMDGWAVGAPISPVSPEGGSMLEMTLALVRAREASNQLILRNGGLPSSSREFTGFWKASMACIRWYQRSLSLFEEGSEELWEAHQEGFFQRLRLLQDRELEYLVSLQG